MPEPETAFEMVPLNKAWKAGRATNRDGNRIMMKKTTSVTEFLEASALA